MKIKMILIVMVAVIYIPEICMADDILIIGNSTIPTSILSKKDVANIFLGKKKIWDDRSKIVVFIQDKEATHQKFLKENIQKSDSQFAYFWKKLIFTGKAKAPIILKDDQEMVKHVSNTKGSIGYVSSNADLENVKRFSIK